MRGLRLRATSSGVLGQHDHLIVLHTACSECMLVQTGTWRTKPTSNRAKAAGIPSLQLQDQLATPIFGRAMHLLCMGPGPLRPALIC